MLDDADKARRQRQDRNVIRTFWFALGAGVVAILFFASTSGVNALRVLAIGLLVGGAAALLAGLLGFLFGLPRADSSGGTGGSKFQKAAAADESGPPALQPGVQDGVNNNLLEISDWLTKIIIGAGLVGLKELVPWLGGVAEMVGHGAGLADRSVARVFGGSLLTFFGSWGFLFVYIETRTIISLIFAKMQQSLRELRREVQEAVTKAVQENVMPQLDKAVSENFLLAKLYSSEADAPREVIDRAKRLLSTPENRGNGRVWLYLACAYGQLHMKTTDDAERRQLSDDAYEALQQALNATPAIKATIAGLMFPDDANRLPGDDDLETFAAEERFRKLAGR
jgi:hypothetical protein